MPIRLIVGFAPGGATDITARLVAVRLTQQLGTQVIVENRSGAAGNIAAAVVAHAKPDGYTLFYTTSSIASASFLYKKLQYDHITDFSPVVLVASAPLLLVANNGLSATSVKELVAFAKSHPIKLITLRLE